jgi:hypothetical protein
VIYGGEQSDSNTNTNSSFTLGCGFETVHMPTAVSQALGAPAVYVCIKRADASRQVCTPSVYAYAYMLVNGLHKLLGKAASEEQLLADVV